MSAERQRSLSLTLGLIFLLTLLGSTLYGCGGSGSNSTALPTAVGGGTSGGGGGGTPSPLSGLTATVVVQNNLSALKGVWNRVRTQSAGVPTTATVFVYTGYDPSGARIFGPFNGPRAPQQTLTGVPIEVTRIQVDYQNEGGQSLAFASFPVTLTSGATVAVTAGLASAFTMQFVNDSGVPDSQVYVLVAANPTAQDSPQVVSGCAVINSYSNHYFPAFGEATGHGTQLTNLVHTGVVASTTRPNKFNNVYSFTVSNLISGRLYVTYGDNPLFSPTHPTPGSLVYAAPSADANFRWDVMEMTIPSASPYPVSYADLTSIQFLGIPMQIQTYADADAQQGQAQQATNNPQAGPTPAIVFGNTSGIIPGSQVAIGDGTHSEVATVSRVTSAPNGIIVTDLTNNYTRPYVTLVGDTALQTRTFYASTPTLLDAAWRLTASGDNRMQWAFQYVGNAPAPTPAPSPTPTPTCSPSSSPSPTPIPSPPPNVAQRGYPSSSLGTWLLPANAGQTGAFLRVQGPQTTVSEPWLPAASPNPALITPGDPNTFTAQRPYRAYPYPTFADYMSTMDGNCYTFGGANSCGGTATQWYYGGTVTKSGGDYTVLLTPLAAMSPDATLGCGAGSSSGESLPTNLPVSVQLNPNDVQNMNHDLDFIVYSTPGGVFDVSVPCNLVSALDNSVYANIADNALAGLQFGYVNGHTAPNDARVWFAGFPAFPPFGAARTTNDGLYNPYAAIIYNYSDSYGFPYSDRINQFNPLVTTTNIGVAASSTMRVTLLNDLRPDAPANLQLSSGTDGTTVTATWNPATRNANDPTRAVSYTVTITDGLPTVPAAPATDRQVKVVSSGTQCSFSGLRPGTTYEARVTATYADGTVSSSSGKACVLTAGTAQVVTTPATGGTPATFTVNFAWDSGNLSDATQFTLNVPGQAPMTLNKTTPVSFTATGVVGTNLIPFTVTTTDPSYPSTVPPLPGAPATVVDSGAFFVSLSAASATTYNVGSVYMTDGSTIVLPSNAGGPITGPYNDNGTAISGGNGRLVLTATLSPNQGGNFQKVVGPVLYATPSPAPAGPYTCPSTAYTPPAPSATPCPAISFTPASGLPGSTVDIQLYVNGTLQSVMFNGVPAASYTTTPPVGVGGLTVIHAVVPYNGTASGRIEVATSLGATVTPTDFTVISPTFTVSSTSATVGQTLTLTANGGFSFATAGVGGATVVQWQNGCTIGSDSAPVVSGSSLTTHVPTTVEAGPNILTVLLPHSVVATLDVSQTFIVANPSFTVAPTSGPRGSTVTLTPVLGSSLSGLRKVTFHGSSQNPAATPGANGAYTVQVPGDATTGTITAQTGDFVSGTSTTPFTVTMPTCTVSPSSGVYNDTVTLTASATGGFTPLPDGALNVQFGSGGPAVLVGAGNIDATKTTITIGVPVGALTGTVTVLGCAAGSVPSSNPFTVDHPAIPGLTPFSPASGAANTTVTITGTGFNAANQVLFTSGAGTIPGTNVTHVDGTTITVKVPSGATTGPVRVIDATNQGTVSTASFTVTP